MSIQSSAASGGGAISQTLSLGFGVSSVQTLINDAVAALDGVRPSQPPQANAANRVRSDAASAVTLMGQAKYSEGLAKWLSASDELRGITGLDTSAARQALAIAVQVVQQQLCGQSACIRGELDFTVNNTPSQEVPLQANIVGKRTVYNDCPAPITDVSVTASWINRRTGTSVQNLWDNLNLAGNSDNRRDNGWQAQGQENDVIDVTLTAQWPTASDLLHLDRNAFQLIVLPPRLSGTLSANPNHAKAGTTVSLSRSLSNSGALGKDILVKLRITNTSKGGVLVQDISQTVTLNPGETNNANVNWQVQGPAGDQLKIELMATVGGISQILATTTFKVDP